MFSYPCHGFENQDSIVDTKQSSKHVMRTDSFKSGLRLTSAELAWIAENSTVLVRFSEHPPYLFSKKGKPVGIAVDMLNVVSEHTGIKFQYGMASPPFPVILKGLIEHEGPDMICSLRFTSEREEKILFTEPYITMPTFIFTRDDAPFVSSINYLSDKTVAVINAYIVHKELERKYPNIDLLICKSSKEALTAVSSGKVFAYLGGLAATARMINQYGLTNLKASAPSSLPNATIAMGIRSDWPELRSIINKVFINLPESEKSFIINRWFSVTYEYNTRYKYILKWGLGVGVAIICLILVFIRWNRTLRRRVGERTVELENEIAERRRAHNELAKSEARYRNLVDSSVIGVFHSKLDGSIVFVNDAMARMSDFENSEKMVAEGALSRWKNTEQRDLFLAALEEHGHVNSFDTEMLTHTGRNLHVLISAKLHYENITGMVIDITDRKKLDHRLQAYQQRLKALTLQLAIAEESERRRIATALHDKVAQSLALTGMQLKPVCDSVSDPKLSDNLNFILETVSTALQDVRKLMYNLVSPLTDKIGLSTALSQWLEQYEYRGQHQTIEFENNISETLEEALDDQKRDVIFRNVRELVINGIKHSKAESISVCIDAEGDSLKILVQDDGIGFDYDAVSNEMTVEKGFGLFSIKEHMEDIGGTFDVKSSPGKGCTATLLIPIKVEIKHEEL